MKTDCEAIESLLGAWLDGELDRPDVERVEMHVQGCSSCLKTKECLEQIQASLKDVLGAEAARLPFDPFWNGVSRRISEKRAWHTPIREWWASALYPQRLAWAIPVVIVFLLGVLSLEQFFPGWRWGSNPGNAAAVDSIDGHGLNVAVFRESKTKTTVIWLFENQEDENESAEDAVSTDTSF